MSTLRNAVQRRNHKERAQPLEREKWGVLEKHKDYSLRAKDFNEKKKRLRILREKAAERNPDEFHFGMMRSRSHHGRKIADRGNEALSQEAVKLLKTQDTGYLRTMLQKARKERERLEKDFLLRDGSGVKVVGQDEEEPVRNHTVFVESVAEQRGFDPEEWFGTDAEGLKKAYNRPRTSSNDDSKASHHATGGGESQTATAKIKSKRVLEAELQAKKDQKALKRWHKRSEEARGHRLEAARKRERDLAAAEREVEIQRARMSNSIGGVNRNGVKWKVRERKR